MSNETDARPDAELVAEICEALRKRGWFASDGAASSEGTSRARSYIPDALCHSAATELERFSDEIERLSVAASILQKLVTLKYGPRDDTYRATKDAAWDEARIWLAAASGAVSERPTP